MADIIQFPPQDERDWLSVESFIRKRLKEAQAPEVVISEVLSWQKELWLKLREQPIHHQIEAPEVCRESIVEVAYAVVDQMREKLYLTMIEAAAQKTRLEMLKYEHNL